MEIGTAVTSSIAALSLAVSIFVWWRQRQVEGRAHFTAEWETPGSIAYVNHGPGAAKEVTIKLDSKVRPVEQSIPYIGAFQSMRVEVVRALAAPPPQRLDVSWRDNRRGRQSLGIHLPDPPPTRPHGSSSRRDAVERVLRDMAREEAGREIEDHDRYKRFKRRMD